jgi:hypothetical protein
MSGFYRLLNARLSFWMMSPTPEKPGKDHDAATASSRENNRPLIISRTWRWTRN